MNERTEENDPRVEKAIRELPAGIEPARDLWPDIEARIRESGAPGGQRRGGGGSGADRWRWLAIAAALVIAATSLVLGLRDGQEPSAGFHLPQPIDLGGNGWDAQGASSREVLGALDARADELDPATVRTIRENLALIDRALAEIEAALEDDPANAGLARMRMTGERRRSEVLRKAADLAGSI